jgi:hypothetical protein
MGNAYKVLVENIKGRNNLGITRLDRQIILKWTFRKTNGVSLWTGFMWFSKRYCEHCNKSSNSVTTGNLLAI